MAEVGEHDRAGALAIEAVDVEDRGFSKEAGNPGNRAIGNIADEDYIRCGEGDVNQRQEGMEGSVEVLPRNGGQNDARDAGRDDVVRRRERPAAVHSDFVAASRQTSR